MTTVRQPRLILVRHTEVDDRYQGLCYGVSDVEIEKSDERSYRKLVDELCHWNPAAVLHSGLQRTQGLAEDVAARLNLCAAECKDLRERDFGLWEMRPWDEIFERHGDEMLRMVSEPDAYRPGGGETTFEMRDRVMRWFNSLQNSGPTIAVTHGGPMASLLGTLQDLPVEQWVHLIPQCGQVRLIYGQGENGRTIEWQGSC